jgi:hypothetical protein
MKQVNISIHPFSALVGMAVLSMAWVTAAAMPLQGSSSDRDVSAIEDVSRPHPRDYVRIHEGAPFTVPEGKVLSLTGITGYGGTPRAELTFNSSNIFTLEWDDKCFCRFPEGLSAGPLTVVEPVTPSSVGPYNKVLLGYLVDA